MHVKGSRLFSHQIVGCLIRDGSITAQVAKSLMNDSTYAHESMQRLVSMAEGMLTALDREHDSVAGPTLSVGDLQVSKLLRRR